METGNGNKRLLEEGKGISTPYKKKTMGSWLKMNCLKVALAVTFVGVNLVLYKQSTREYITNFLGYPSGGQRWTPDNVSTTPASLTEMLVSPTVRPGDVIEDNASSLQAGPVSPSTNSLLVKTYPFLGDPIVNPHPFNYIIFPSKVNCSGREVELAICVPISRNNFEGRQTVRETWGSYANVTGNRAVLLFFIGSGDPGAPSENQRRIEVEARTFGDILQEDYIDHYNNLSLKSVSIVKWVTTHCPGSRYLLKADDDMYVNVPLLVRTVTSLALSSDQPAFAVGSEQFGARPIRDSNSKWYTPYSMFKGNVYPNYVSGTAYAMTALAARLLYEASLRVPIFWLEDIYITGICALKAGVSVIHSNMFSYGKPDASGCTFRAHISGHRYSQEEIRLIHTQLYDPKTVCEKT